MDTVYKYFPLNQFLLSTILYNEIWFSSPENFNDPFDCNINCQYVKDIRYDNEINEILHQERKRTAVSEPYYLKESMLNNIALTIDNRNKSGVFFSNLTLKVLYKYVGISCFSKKHNNILMWSHYADNHNGVCLKFNTTDKDFFEECHAVTYLERLPSFQDRNNFSDPQKFLFYTKSKDWEYEAEVRVLKKSNQLFNFDPVCLEAIYFGVKCKVSESSKVINIIKGLSKYEKVKFYQMELDDEGFNLIEKEIK
ncbi:hypothetical protein DF185_01065 [Marinifilum breve]|uniref:DUF2971 domain-containing protein n=1 Tax=Marinifilum breve TaxID=2184082 RepID=A0A2V4AF39_9BACT|nr:DUF2971 domain-containing protein [Marinifilum breve]PXY02714.1 hypothetical protein DF185_01065 [Marinifilum breve]